MAAARPAAIHGGGAMLTFARSPTTGRARLPASRLDHRLCGYRYHGDNVALLKDIRFFLNIYFRTEIFDVTIGALIKKLNCE